jgi:hypothetical protein
MKIRTKYNSNGDIIEEWVERVRCSDCKHFIVIENLNRTFCMRNESSINVEPDDYCSKFEEKDNG